MSHQIWIYLIIAAENTKLNSPIPKQPFTSLMRRVKVEQITLCRVAVVYIVYICADVRVIDNPSSVNIDQ